MLAVSPERLGLGAQTAVPYALTVLGKDNRNQQQQVPHPIHYNTSNIDHQVLHGSYYGRFKKI